MEPRDKVSPEGGEEDLSDVKQPLMRVMRALVFRDVAATPLSELPFLQVRCLYALGRQEGRKMNEVAEKLEVKLPAMSQIVDRLVKRGMVERRDDPDDRRIVRLYLTDEARGILAQARAARRARLGAALSHLTADERARVAEGLRLLASAAERIEAPTPSTAALSLDTDPLVEMMACRARTHRARQSAETDGVETACEESLGR